MATPGQKLFSKKLTKTDVDHRLYWPSKYLAELPDFNGDRLVDFTAKDIDSKVWNFRCKKRITGPYTTAELTTGWLPFLRSKGDIKAGDEIIFYRSSEQDADFEIRFKKQIRLFGVDISA